MFTLIRAGVAVQVPLVIYNSVFHVCFFAVSAAEKAEREKSQAPVYMVKLRDTDAILGSTASFMIHVRGNPNPEVQL